LLGNLEWKTVGLTETYIAYMHTVNFLKVTDIGNIMCFSANHATNIFDIIYRCHTPSASQPIDVFI